MHISSKQKEMLLNNLNDHEELVKGQVDRKSESKRKLTWKDMKSYILKKEAKKRNYVQGTGGGSPCNITFFNFEEEVLIFLTPEAAGLTNIPEGGLADNVEIQEPEMFPCSEEVEHAENMQPNNSITNRNKVKTSV